MKLDIKSLSRKLEPAKEGLAKYGNLVALGIVVALFSFVLYRIGHFNALEPTSDAIEEKLLTSQRPRIDKDIVQKLEKLEDQNIQVQTLFNQARENPFQE